MTHSFGDSISVPGIDVDGYTISNILSNSIPGSVIEIGSITADRIDSIAAAQITGTITAGQIGTITAGQITGTLNAAQINTITAGQITGQLNAGQINTITAGQITGTLTAGQIDTINSNQITGLITAAQIDTVNAADITGTITAAQIDTVNASDITGTVTAAQIDTIAAGQITGQLTSSQIASVAAASITGSITSSQIGSVAAATITGTITAAQIDTVNASDITGTITAAQIDTVNASDITGSISAAQIGTVNAGSVGGTGSISSAYLNVATLSALTSNMGTLNAGSITGATVQTGSSGARMVLDSSGLIGYDTDGTTKVLEFKTSDGSLAITGAFSAGSTIPASAVTGQLDDSQISDLDAAKLTGLIDATQIDTINAGQIAGLITAAQIDTVNAGDITGTITAAQIDTVNAADITGTITAAQIDTVNAGDITGTITAGQIATLTAGQITGTLTSSQIASVAAGTITGTLTSSQIASVAAGTITGTITSGQIASVAAGTITGTLTSGQIASVAAGTITGTLTAGQITSINANQINITVGLSDISDDVGVITAGVITGATVQTAASGARVTMATSGLTAHDDNDEVTVSLPTGVGESPFFRGKISASGGAELNAATASPAGSISKAAWRNASASEIAGIYGTESGYASQSAGGAVRVSATAPSNYNDIIAANSPLHYWMMDVASSPDTGSGNDDLTVADSGTMDTRSALHIGSSGSIEADLAVGAHNHKAGSGGTLSPSEAHTTVTMEGWVNFVGNFDDGGDVALFGYWQSSANSALPVLLFYVDFTSRKLILHARNGSATTVEITDTSSDQFEDQGTCHIYCTYDSSAGANNLKMYVNGAARGTATLTGALDTSSHFRVGHTVGSADTVFAHSPDQTKFDSIATYNTVLNTTTMGYRLTYGTTGVSPSATIREKVVLDSDNTSDYVFKGTDGPHNITSGTSFPSSPSNGDIHYYDADTTNGVVWAFKFRPASSSSYEWEFIGGAALATYVATTQSTSSTSYGQLGTSVAITAPLAGDYDVQFGVRQWNNTNGGAARTAISVNSTTTITSNTVIETYNAVSNTNTDYGSRRVRVTGVTATHVIRCLYSALIGGTASFEMRELHVTPVRVSG